MSSDDEDALDLSFLTKIPDVLVSLYALNGFTPNKMSPHFCRDIFFGKEAPNNVCVAFHVMI